MKRDLIVSPTTHQKKLIEAAADGCLSYCGLIDEVVSKRTVEDWRCEYSVPHF